MRKKIAARSIKIIALSMLLSSNVLIIPTVFATETGESESETAEVVESAESAEASSQPSTTPEAESPTESESALETESAPRPDSITSQEVAEEAGSREEETADTSGQIPAETDQLPEGETSVTAEGELVVSDVPDEFANLEIYDREAIFEMAMEMMENDLKASGETVDPMNASKNYTANYLDLSTASVRLVSTATTSYVDTFLDTIIPYAIQDSGRSGILPSITIAQAALESGWGLSTLTKQANNLFGIKASSDWNGAVYNIITSEYVDPVYNSSGTLVTAGYWYQTVAPFRKYDSWLGSIQDHGDFFTSTAWRKENYKNVVGEKNYTKAAQALQDSGYATDPTYASKLISIIEAYDLYKYDALPTVSGSVYVEGQGWQTKTGTTVALGTTGQGLKVEGLNLSLEDYTGLGITYAANIQGQGWTSYVSENTDLGNILEGKQIEAIKVQLTGDSAGNFDIYYRTHVQSFGWTGWAKNGAPTGTEGYGKRIEAIEVKVVYKGDYVYSTGTAFRTYTSPNISYTTHVQTYGWLDEVSNGLTSGTVGEAKRLEAIKLSLSNTPFDGSIQYQTHVQTYGWMNTVSNGTLSGTVGEGKRLEAIKISLTGGMSNEFDIYYRTHVQTYGWTGWAKNGQPSGSQGLQKRLEAIEVKLVKKGDPAPGDTNNTFIE